MPLSGLRGGVPWLLVLGVVFSLFYLIHRNIHPHFQSRLHGTQVSELKPNKAVISNRYFAVAVAVLEMTAKAANFAIIQAVLRVAHGRSC